ncbi:sigma-70 family RNA polymerase sigma factor [Agromyces sp. CFH 90414]|uniref:Sigma-70 family RNA polymerase sigma factor n=1 Tax=Agromyces agglutinans TaxID=2662258 RepID=A0A6I2FD49_9MICO|nr:sigma-70 family RNA polymerase sigma factor [Agromyces agglutinans]MRG61727.1 sigma-70 family RNA polymerase sigma factor [Agromyces agglutinans]
MTATWDAVATRLVAERGDALVRYAYLLTGSDADAADLVQDALVRTFGRPRPQLTPDRAEAYVRRAVLNAVIDRSRREGTWRGIRHLVAAPSAIESSTSATDLRLDLAARVRRLAPRQAACIVLRYYEDLTVDQVAATLGISPGAVKRYLSDALRALSSALERDGSPRQRRGGADVRA